MAKIAVIGGGAAGMIAAIAAAGNGHSVTLLEKNEKLGKKIYITGKGRCNVTNACEFDAFLQQITENSRFLYSALRGFFNDDICALLEGAGCPLKVERGDRVFPVSDHASDVTRALSRLLHERGVSVRLLTAVKVIEREEAGGFRLRLSEKRSEKAGTGADKGNPKAGVREAENEGTMHADAVIVCTGGLSYPSTGSTGDGYRFAQRFGLQTTDTHSSLVPLTVSEQDARDLQGLSLRNCAVSITSLSAPAKPLYEDFGELLFTHFGLSGPLILRASAHLTKRLSAGECFRLSIDLKPALSKEQLSDRVLRDFSGQKNSNLQNAISKLLPSALRPVLLCRAGLMPDKKVHDITRAERLSLVETMKDLTFTITGTRGFSEAVVTKGGVSVSEINPKTMEAKHVPGLYFAGEVLDIDAMTGGFNLQLAWSTGYAAGVHAGSSLT